MALGFFTGQIGYMKARGFKIQAISSPGVDLKKFAEREQVAAHAVEMPRRITPLRDLVAIFQLWRTLHRIRPAIVHAHTPKGGLLGTVAAWLARVPVRIYHMHGLPFTTANGCKRLLLRWSERVACLLTHQVFCVSRSVREVALAESLCRPEKIKVLLRGSINGVDAGDQFNPEKVGGHARKDVRSKYGIPVDDQVVGFVGRVVRDKGLAELAAAWRILREESPALHLLVVGPFEPQDPVPPQVEALLRGDPRIHLTGMVDNTPPLYTAMDIVALPTYREGFPNIPLEAAAMALPVVATRIPGCVDAVEDGVTGTLVPPRDAAALAKAIHMYLEDPALRRTHGLAGRKRVLRDFRPEAMWEALHQEYVRLLREKRLPIPESSASGSSTQFERSPR